MKIYFEIWNWSWKVQLFLLLFSQKNVKFFNFSFKYIKIKASYKGFDYCRWRTNYIFLWYLIDLWTSIEMVEKIKHLDHFLGHFSDWREKTPKMKISSCIYSWKCFFCIEVAAFFIFKVLVSKSPFINKHVQMTIFALVETSPQAVLRFFVYFRWFSSFSFFSLLHKYNFWLWWKLFCKENSFA